MDLLLAFCVFLVSIITTVIFDFQIAFALLIGLISFIAVGMHRGFFLGDLIRMALKSAKTSIFVLKILVLIGLLTAFWRSSGTIAFFVTDGMSFITPSIFILAAFVLCAVLSIALGTCFGVVSSVGVIFMALARSGGVSEIITAGAVISGAYFGDRCSAVSGSANLIAAVTRSTLYDNVKLMYKTAALPTVVTIGIYAALSFANPIQQIDQSVLDLIGSEFSASLWVLVPAVLMIALPMLKIPVGWAMTVSIVTAALCSLFVQDMGIVELLKVGFFGFEAQGEQLGQILNGGGIMSMLNVAIIVTISGTYSGIFKGTRMLDDLEEKLSKLSLKIGRFQTMTIVGIVTCGAFCSQTVAIMMGGEIMSSTYDKQDASRSELAIDMENSSVLLAGLLPWAISGAFPLEALGVSAAALPFAFFLYLVPLLYAFTKPWFFKKSAKINTNGAHNES